MIEDYDRLHSRFPTSKEFEDKLNMSEATVKRYKNAIIKQKKIALFGTFSEKILHHAAKAFEEINKNIKIFEDIRDSLSFFAILIFFNVSAYNAKSELPGISILSKS